MSNMNEVLELGAEMSAQTAAANGSNLSAALSGAAGSISSGLNSAANWVRENPVGGVAATLVVGVGVGYLAYKAFSGKEE